MARWVLKPVELHRATKRLNIKHPVSVKPFSGWWAGEYDCSPLHMVWVNRKAGGALGDPSWTIWHELGHALQCERDFGGDGDCWEEVMGRVYSDYIDANDQPLICGDWDQWLEDYNSIPFEQEANDIADKYSERYPLVRIIS